MAGTTTTTTKSNANPKSTTKKGNRKPTKSSIKSLIKKEILRTKETKHIFDTIGSNTDGTTDGSRAVTCFRVQRGDRFNERDGIEITPVGIRIDYHVANTVLNQMMVKIVVLELKSTRAINAGNAGTYVLDNFFQADITPDGLPVDSSSLTQAERLTQPLFTDLFKVLGTKTIEMSKPNALGTHPSYGIGTMYVKMKDQTPITYSNTSSTRPGDPDVSRNIVVCYFGASPDIRTTVPFAAYNARLNIRQYYKDT